MVKEWLECCRWAYIRHQTVSVSNVCLIPLSVYSTVGPKSSMLGYTSRHLTIPPSSRLHLFFNIKVAVLLPLARILLSFLQTFVFCSHLCGHEIPDDAVEFYGFSDLKLNVIVWVSCFHFGVMSEHIFMSACFCFCVLPLRNMERWKCESAPEGLLAPPTRSLISTKSRSS